MNKKGYFFLGLTMVFFSTMEIAVKFIVNDFHPLQLNFIRFFVGGLTLLPFSLFDIKNRKLKLSSKDILSLFLIGLFAVPISMTLFQTSLLYMKASIVAVLMSSNAIFVAPISFFILKEKIDKALAVSLVFGIIGMFIIANPSSAMSANDFLGMTLAIGASVTFAAFSVLGKKMAAKLGGLTMNSFVFLFGSISLLPYLFVKKIPVFSGINSHNIPYLLYISFGVTAIAYILMSKGLTYLPANKGSLLFFIKPVLAGFLANLILGETFSFNLTIGTLFIMSGILFTVVFSSKPNIKRAEI